jgi:hypothetical protein
MSGCGGIGPSRYVVQPFRFFHSSEPIRASREEVNVSEEAQNQPSGEEREQPTWKRLLDELEALLNEVEQAVQSQTTQLRE